MVNVDQLPPSSNKGASVSARVSREARYWILNYPAGGVYVAPLVYVPAAVAPNRSFLAVVAGAWLVGQVTSGILLLSGDGFANDEIPQAKGQAVLAQLIGLAPWIVLIFSWSALTTPALCGIVALLAAWGSLALLISGGDGDTLGQRIRASTYRGAAWVTAGLFGFAGFVVALVLLIKGLHPLS